MARLPGRGNTRAFALMGHYDSVRYGPGAADNGASVAALLETARALRAGPPLSNDVLFVFTDGEETGLFGAKAFGHARNGVVGPSVKRRVVSVPRHHVVRRKRHVRVRLRTRPECRCHCQV